MNSNEALHLAVANTVFKPYQQLEVAKLVPVLEITLLPTKIV